MCDQVKPDYSKATLEDGVWVLSSSSAIDSPVTQPTAILLEWEDFFLNNDDIIEGPLP